MNNILYATFDIYNTLNVHTITATCLSGIGYIIIRIDSSFRKIVSAGFEFCALHIMCFLYIKNGWNFLLLYNIDVAIPFMWRPDNRHILTPEFYRMNPKYCTFNSWSSHFLYTCVYRSLCTMNLHWDVHVSQTMHTKGYKCWSYMINNLTMVYKPMYFFYNSTINSQVYFSWLRLLVFSRCTRYNIMG